jgi:hypothetical protein
MQNFDSLKSSVRALTWILGALVIQLAVALSQLWLAGSGSLHIARLLALEEALPGGAIALCAIVLVIGIRKQLSSRSVSE